MTMTTYGRQRDSQRAKVYKWERESLFPRDRVHLSLEDCKDIVSDAFDLYGIPTPTVADGRGTRWARGSLRRINLPIWARTLPVVLHESAHGITSRFDATAAPHGPLFVRIYIDLASRFMDIPISDLRRSARAKRIRVGRAAACCPPPRRDAIALKKAREDMLRLKQEYTDAGNRYRVLYEKIWGDK